MDSAAVEAVLVPILKAAFLVLLAGGTVAVLRQLVLLARGRRSAAAPVEKGSD